MSRVECEIWKYCYCTFVLKLYSQWISRCKTIFFKNECFCKHGSKRFPRCTCLSAFEIKIQPSGNVWTLHENITNSCGPKHDFQHVSRVVLSLLPTKECQALLHNILAYFNLDNNSCAGVWSAMPTKKSWTLTIPGVPWRGLVLDYHRVPVRPLSIRHFFMACCALQCAWKCTHVYDCNWLEIYSLCHLSYTGRIIFTGLILPVLKNVRYCAWCSRLVGYLWCFITCERCKTRVIGSLPCLP